jgi:hypothetical protein
MSATQIRMMRGRRVSPWSPGEATSIRFQRRCRLASPVLRAISTVWRTDTPAPVLQTVLIALSTVWRTGAGVSVPGLYRLPEPKAGGVSGCVARLREAWVMCARLYRLGLL